MERYLKKFIEDNNLPVLERKWKDVVVEENKYEKAAKRAKEILDLFNQGKKVKEISKTTSLSRECVYRVLKIKSKDYFGQASQ